MNGIAVRKRIVLFDEMVAAVRRIVEKDAALKPLETLLAAHPETAAGADALLYEPAQRMV